MWWYLTMSQPLADRRDAIDVARVLALVVVVVGHLTLAVIDRSGGSVRGANLLALHPEWAWLAAAAPMPIFFAAAGWANAGASAASAAPRLRSLVGVAAVVVVAWSTAGVVAEIVAGEAGVVADGARVATQPVWFLAAYVPFTAAGGLLARAAARSPVTAIGGCLVVLAALDLARFGLGAPDWIGWPGFFLAWGVPWLAGGWWRDRASRGLYEQRVGFAVAAIATVVAVVLVHRAGYAPALIDAVDGVRSNTTPPTLYTAVVGLGQVGILLVGAGALDAAGRRWRRLWDRAGDAAVGVYLWHLSALALCGGAVALGLPVPERLTSAWWITRPLWWAAVIAVALGFVAATAAARGVLRNRSTPSTPLSRTCAIAGVAVAAAGAGLVGLRGPRTAPLALACSALFIASWVALGDCRIRPRRSGRSALGR